VARCFAHLGRFREAERALEAAGYTASWSRFAGDPAFAEMKEHPRYEERFEP